MLKLFKTVIKGNEGTEDTYGHDTGHRVTMGYNADTKTISVKVEEVIPPNPDLDESLPEGTDTILRDPHTTADFKVVATRDFTEADFVQKADNYKWIIEYDADTKSISNPIDVYEISKQYVDGSNSHEKIYYNLNEYRYNANTPLSPLFVIDSFFKSLGFEGSTLQFFVEDYQFDLMDTVLEVGNQQVTAVTPKEYEFWCNTYVRVMVTFEVLDANGKIVSSAYPTVKPTAKAENFRQLVQKQPVDTTGINPELQITPSAQINGNRFYVKLPASDQHIIRVMFGSKIHNIINSRPFVTFDVECVNGVASKTRLTNEYDPQNPNVYVQEFIANHNHPADKMAHAFGGVEGVIVSTLGLISGEYFKLKLNLGEFTSWAELWVEIE